MAIVNALLVQWSGGTFWAEDAGSIAAHGRSEGFAQLGTATSEPEAARLAQAVLATRLAPTVELSGVVEPAGGDEPYVAFGVGDTVTAPNEAMTPATVEVRELTISTDEDGNPIYGIAFDTVHTVEEARLQRWLNRMSHGSLSGTAESAAPLPLPTPPPTAGQYRTLDAFSWNGSPEAPTTSQAQKSLVPVRVLGVEVTITADPATSGTVSGHLVFVPFGGTTFTDIPFSFAAGSYGGRVMLDPAVAPVSNGPGGDQIECYLGATSTATGVVVKPIVG